MRPNLTALNILMSKKRTDHDSYTWFYDNVLSFIVGRSKWKKQCQSIAGIELASPSDEALALLILENSWEFWIQKHRRAINQESDDEAETVKTKYTSEGLGKREYKGWNEAGLKRMNELLQEVKLDRAINNGAFDQKYKNQKSQEKNGKKRKRKDATASTASTIVEVDEGNWSD